MRFAPVRCVLPWFDPFHGLHVAKGLTFNGTTFLTHRYLYKPLLCPKYACSMLHASDLFSKFVTEPQSARFGFVNMSGIRQKYTVDAFW